MSGRHLQPDFTRGDVDTIGGYAAVHGRPAAFEGSDGHAYSVEPSADRVQGGEGAYGAYLLFLRWRRIGAPGVEGHLETPYLAWGESAEAALGTLGRLPLQDVRELLELRLAETRPAPARPWWEAMRDADDADDTDAGRDDARRDDAGRDDAGRDDAGRTGTDRRDARTRDDARGDGTA